MIWFIFVEDYMRPMHPYSLLAATLAVVVSAASCSPMDKVTEEDRVLVHYNREAWSLAGQVSAVIQNDPAAAAVAMATVVSKYGVPLSQAMVKNWGPPKTPPPPMTEGEVKRALDDAAKAKETPWYYTAGATALTVILGLLSFGSKFAHLMPGGSALSLGLKATMGAAELWMQKKKSEGPEGKEDAKDLASFLSAAQDDPKVRPVIDKMLNQVKRSLGITGIASLIPPAEPSAPTTAGSKGV